MYKLFVVQSIESGTMLHKYHISLLQTRIFFSVIISKAANKLLDKLQPS